MRCPRCQQENPLHAKFCLGCGTPLSDVIVIGRPYADLQAEIDGLRRELGASVEQQTATSEILRVISNSPPAVQPVFDAIAHSAARLCGAAFASVVLTDGAALTLAASTFEHDAFAPFASLWPMPVEGSGLQGIALRERTIVILHDAESDDRIAEWARPIYHTFGLRSGLWAPMVRDGVAIGIVFVVHEKPAAFVNRHVVMLQTFADQAVIAIENVRLFSELQDRNVALTEAHARVSEALEQQTATAEILRVISSSPTDVQPVLDVMAESAARLCEAADASIFRVQADRIRLVAQHGEMTHGPVGEWSLPLVRQGVAGRSVIDARTVHLADVLAEAEEFPVTTPNARRVGFRAMLSVPLVRDGVGIGAIQVFRSDARLFSKRQVALLETFADQAVIAIENVRLFNETKEALEQQTATGEILKVIARSPTDVQPVFDTIARNAVRLCGGVYSTLYRVEGALIHFVGHHNFTPDQLDTWRRTFPRPVEGTGVPVQRVVRTGTVYRIGDPEAQDDTDTDALTRAGQRARGLQSLLIVPMFRQHEVIGAIGVTHRERNAFTDAHVELLKTFADQAVIAIENVRLFTELQASNRELTTALETQTATSDILHVISRSQTNVQPVFDAILDSAVRLLRGYSGVVTRIAGDEIELAALTSTDDAGDAALRALFPQSLYSEVPHPQAMRDRAPINITDAQTDPRVPEAVRANARARGYRSWITVPLLRHDEAVGTIGVTRRESGGFTADEIALLQTFADQAVIAIENARLLTELQARTQELTRSVAELRALGEVGQAISSTLDLQTVLSTIVARATQLSGTDAGVIYEYDEEREVFVPRATEHLEAEIVETMLATPVRRGEGATGRLAEVPEPIQVPDILAAPAESRVRAALVRAGYRSLLAVPLVRDDHLLGGLTVIRKAPGAFAPEVIELLRTFATQSALAIQNARLFLEIEDKSRQLEAASQHKSEFLANMSHELRTPLNAIIGFSEVLGERMFGELNEKQDEYLKDIHASGQHLLSLINDILDLSKIEAGRMELDLGSFDLPPVVDTAVLLIRERAGRRGIALHVEVDERLGEVRGDERKIKQVLLNLLSNAIKFTPEGGRIEIRANPVNESVEISVSDTGVGIASEDQEAVFEEFRQVGTAKKKAEGTGLGLALARRFVELHGGRIWVQSQVGAGSTFTFTIPMRTGV